MTLTILTISLSLGVMVLVWLIITNTERLARYKTMLLGWKQVYLAWSEPYRKFVRSNTIHLRQWLVHQYQFYRWQKSFIYSPSAIAMTICFFITMIAWGIGQMWPKCPAWIPNYGQWVFPVCFALFVLGIIFLESFKLSWDEMTTRQRLAYGHYNPHKLTPEQHKWIAENTRAGDEIGR